MKQSLVDRFWKKVAKYPNGCWEWTSNKNNKGYGMFKISAAVGNHLAHRVAFELANGRFPDGLCVLHRCDNPLCVNPEHLFLGTMKDNVQDMDAKGRRVSNGPKVRGELNCNAKLTDAAVIAIRTAYVAGETTLDLANRYEINRRSIPDILSGKSWRHILGANGSPGLLELKAARRSKRSSRIAT
jgi:hypothetical protein